MTKPAQNLLLITLGAAVIWITLVTDEYLNYVKPGFRPVLAAAAVAMIVLGAAGLRREWRGGHSHKGEGEGCGDGHDHGHGPRVAWLLCLPALAIFLIAPPALGSFTAVRNTGRTAAPPSAPAEGYGRLTDAGKPIDMSMGEFIGRAFEAQTGLDNGLPQVRVRLTGFVSERDGGGWRLTRLKMACCAGDAIPFQVIVHGLERPAEDTWVQVVGTWMRPASGDDLATGMHEVRGQSITKIKKPKNPYE